MTKIVIQACDQAKLEKVDEPVEVCSEDGRTLGVFSPVARRARRSPHSADVLEQRRRERTGKTLEEMREDFRKAGIEL
jgi:hypothetical protein